MLETAAVLTPLHCLYLAGVMVILAVMVMRKDTPAVCIGFLFLLGLAGTGNVIGGIQTVFNAMLYAGKEFMEIIATIALVSALSKALSDLGSDYRDRKRNGRTNVFAFSYFHNNRNHRESRMACTGKDCQDIRNNRSEVVNVFWVLVENFLSNVDQIVKTARELHYRDSSDHGSDDQDHIPGDVARFHAKAKTENENASTTGVTNPDSAKTNTNEDRAQQDNDLKNNHDIHSFSLINLGQRKVIGRGRYILRPLPKLRQKLLVTQGESRI